MAGLMYRKMKSTIHIHTYCVIYEYIKFGNLKEPFIYLLWMTERRYYDKDCEQKSLFSCRGNREGMIESDERFYGNKNTKLSKVKDVFPLCF